MICTVADFLTINRKVAVRTPTSYRIISDREFFRMVRSMNTPIWLPRSWKQESSAISDYIIRNNRTKLPIGKY